MNKDYTDEWNRKEDTPIRTIKRFQDIFKNVGIKTCFEDYSSHKELWHSVTLHDYYNRNITTKGKGVTRAYSEASACGEFAERLQGEWLYRVPDTSPEYIADDEVNEETKNYLREAFCGKTDYLINERQSEYYDILSKKLVSIPDDLIMIYAGTNGLSAGNTKTEAFVQGTCEIFERYVTKMIYYGNYNEVDFPILDREIYKDLFSYNMIQEIENNGFKCYVKDCSLNGKLPVIGILVFDKSNNRYCFSLSSDLNLDIAIQRCITEIFQHFRMGVSMKLQMFNKLDSQDYWSEKIRDEIGFSKMLFNGTGQLPAWLLKTSFTKASGLSPIGYEKLSNEQCKIKLLNIIKSNNKRILVRDCSYLGIPTLRMVVPGMSEVYYLDNSIDYARIVSEVLNLICLKSKNEKEMKLLYRNISLIFTFPFWEYECSWEKIYGPYICVKYKDVDVDIYLLYASLCLRFKEYDRTIENLRKSCAFSSNSSYSQLLYYVEILIYGFMHGHEVDEIKNVVLNNVDEKTLEQLIGVILNVENVIGEVIVPIEEQQKLTKIRDMQNKYKKEMKNINNYVDDLYLQIN